MMNLFDPKLVISKRKYFLTTWLDNASVLIEASFKKFIKKIAYFSGTSDIWTSSNQDKYLSN